MELSASDSGTPVATSIAPMLSVRHGAKAVDFYKAAFDAIEVFRIEDPGGSVVSRLSVEGAEFWVADESPAHHNFSPESLGGGTVRMILTVADPDAMFARALAAGATQVVAMANAYGWRLGRVLDPFGHHWEIGRPLS
jgi:PhnB protein